MYVYSLSKFEGSWLLKNTTLLIKWEVWRRNSKSNISSPRKRQKTRQLELFILSSENAMKESYSACLFFNMVIFGSQKIGGRAGRHKGGATRNVKIYTRWVRGRVATHDWWTWKKQTQKRKKQIHSSYPNKILIFERIWESKCKLAASLYVWGLDFEKNSLHTCACFKKWRNIR